MQALNLFGLSFLASLFLWVTDSAPARATVAQQRILIACMEKEEKICNSTKGMARKTPALCELQAAQKCNSQALRADQLAKPQTPNSPAKSKAAQQTVAPGAAAAARATNPSPAEPLNLGTSPTANFNAPAGYTPSINASGRQQICETGNPANCLVSESSNLNGSTRFCKGGSCKDVFTDTGEIADVEFGQPKDPGQLAPEQEAVENLGPADTPSQQKAASDTNSAGDSEALASTESSEPPAGEISLGESCGLQGLDNKMINVESVNRQLKVFEADIQEAQQVANSSGGSEVNWAAIHQCRSEMGKAIQGCVRLENEAKEEVYGILCNADTQLNHSKKRLSGSRSAQIGRDHFNAAGMVIETNYQQCLGGQFRESGKDRAGRSRRKVSQKSSKEHKNICYRYCNPGLLAEGKPQELNRARQIMRGMLNYCDDQRDRINNSFVSQSQAARDMARKAGKTMRRFKIGALAGVGAIGAAVLHKQHRDRKKEKERKEQLQREFDAGIARDNEGNKVNCLKPETYLNDECQPVLMSYCQKDENVSKAGCSAFHAGYCLKSDANTNYCVAGEAKSYCSKSIPGLESSPSCQWLDNRPDSCKANPGDLNCLVSKTPSELTQECQLFASDPLCQAHFQGKIVTAPTEGSSPSYYSDASTGLGSQGLDTLVRSPSSTTTNMWQEASQSLSSLCQQGQLRGCN